MPRETTPPAGGDAVLRADPRLQRVAVLAVGAAIALAVVGFPLLDPYLASVEMLAARDPAAAVARLARLTTLVFGALGVATAGTGVSLFLSSRRALAAGCFPAPGTRVLRDTPLLTGDAARRKALAAAVLALLLAIVGAAAPLLASHFVRRFATRALTRRESADYSVAGSAGRHPKPPSTDAAIHARVA